MLVKNLGYVSLFIAIQLASLVLTIVGIPVVAALCYLRTWEVPCPMPVNFTLAPIHFPKWAWIWDNEEDGICPDWYGRAHPARGCKTNAFIWSALRNSCANFKHVKYVSGVGRPLFYSSWASTRPQPKLVAPKVWYFKAGWLSNGYPCLSAGAGKGY